MAPPEKRAVAPGTQPVRVDNIKEKSWVDVRRGSPLIGQIFFATDKPKKGDSPGLDYEDMALLDTIVTAYHPKLVRYGDLKKQVVFKFMRIGEQRRSLSNGMV
jgi:hypothetical protein